MTPNDQNPGQDPSQQDGPDDLDERLRHAFRAGGPHVDAESFLGDVHRGARGRRRRRVASSVLATAAVVAVAAYGVGASGVFDDNSTPAADDHRTPTVTNTGTPNQTETPTSTTLTTGSTEADPKHRALSLSATDSDHQYVLMAGPFGCGKGCLRAYTTSDAGQTWSPTAPLGLLPSDPDPTSETAFDIRFADPDNGWVYGGALLSTHDGGASWNTPTLPAKGIVRLLEAWGPTAYAAVEDPNRGAWEVLRSDTASDVWKPVDLGTPVRYITQFAVAEHMTAVIASQSQVSDGNEIRVSTDDGNTWSDDASPCGARAFPSSVSASGTSLWTVCSDKAQGGDATAYVSTDEGKNWTAVTGTFSPGSMVQARDERTAVVLDVYKSGATMVSVGGQPDRILEGQGNYLPVGFTNPTTGYLESFDYRIVRTLDSGATWQPYPTP